MLYYLLGIILIWVYFRYFGPLIITFKKSSKDTKSPTRAYSRAACWDVYCSEAKVIPCKGWKEVPLGVSFASWPHIYIPFLGITLTPFGNVACKIHTRSGLAIKGLRNHLGIIDNDYRKELSVIIFNSREFPVYFKVGEKIAQIEFYRVSPVWMFSVNKLSKSERGERGFGSSGR